MSQLDFIYDGGQSKRFHTVDTHKIQDIAAHSFGVAWLCELLTAGNASKNLIMAALAHDLAEHMTGDIPSPSKREMNIGQMFHDHEMTKLRIAGLAMYDDDLTEGERFTLKLADNMEGLMFCIRERRLGNRNVEIVYSRFWDYACEVMRNARENEAAQAFCFDVAATDNILRIIHNQWEELTK